jgi:hypothetical protein
MAISPSREDSQPVYRISIVAVVVAWLLGFGLGLLLTSNGRVPEEPMARQGTLESHEVQSKI